MKISGNTILVTGGGTGIGRAFAETFLRLDNKVIIAGRTEENLKEVVTANSGIEYLQLDIAAAETIEPFVQNALKLYPDINVLMNNAGIMRVEDLQGDHLEVAEATVATNLLGPIRLTTAFMPHLLKQKQATIMNVTSGLASVPMCTHPTYSATKSALHSYSISLREQLIGTNVRVVEIVPPYVQTTLTGSAHAEDPNAMPLAEYIKESIQILEGDPDVEEVLVERVKIIRNAEREGRFNEVLQFITKTALKQKSERK
ncbi:MAG: SDR family NAD(P)-dependent oxidoreductase [Bdellovibrionales bacterium]|nr:SDR family NAD(P)-dependent oxidoreductase [Bdellovibrionales bacterium]